METGITEWIYAVRNGELEKLKKLVSSTDLAKPTGDERCIRSKRPKLNTLSELHQLVILTNAIESRQTDIVKYLLAKGFTVTHENVQCDLAPLLHVAIRTESEEVVQMLLNAGVDPNFKDYRGSACLFEAVRLKNIKIVKLLLSKGANINIESAPYITTPLMEAAKTGQIDMINLLLDLGADANKEPYRGRTALSYAVLNNHLEVVKLLLDRGVDINSGRTTALCSAVDTCNEKLIDYLLDHGSKAYLGDFDSRGWTAFHLAAARGQVNTLKKFLKQNFDINLKNKDGETALHMTATKENLEAVKFLLHSGFNVDETNGKNRTALEEVLHELLSGKSEALIMLLIDYGADFNRIKVNYYGYQGVEYNIMYEMYRLGIWSSRFKNKRIQRINMLLRIFARLQSKNVQVSNSILNTIEQYSDLKPYFSQCKKEIESMKKEVFEGTNLSLYDFLETRSIGQLIGYARNPNISIFFQSDNCETKYPCYVEYFKHHFGCYIERQKLLEDVKLTTFFRRLMDKNEEYLPPLPGPCADVIYSYLSMHDLLNLIEV